ncbi:unnamed protein product [Schistosoma margrebowiei]|uniref:Uncharacterized protein n=1 Tax=Schistosoma margrebowiei TaxID=48269 RepID=A0A183LAN9_9TREM|nr:unnamed protein product [Schistosoma margrebowiei]
MCWNNANPIEVSNSLQSNDVIDDPTSKLAQFIYGALKSPNTRLLLMLHQDLSLLRRKPSATHSSLRYTTTTSISCRRHFNLHLTSSHVPETCATVSANLMVRVLFVYRITPPPLRFNLSALLVMKPVNWISLSNTSDVNQVSETAITSGSASNSDQNLPGSSSVISSHKAIVSLGEQIRLPSELYSVFQVKPTKFALTSGKTNLETTDDVSHLVQICNVDPSLIGRFQVSACLVMQFDDLRNVCPIHFHRLFLISSSAGS